MSLTINTAPTRTAPARTAPSRTRSPNRRRRLADALLNEFLAWNPREFLSAFRRWDRGVSLIHLNVLTMLDADGPDSMSHLAEALDVSVASMTGIVDRMEKRGLVERGHTGKDRRVVLVHPTEAGLDVFRDIDRRRREGLARILERLSDDELAGLLTGHRALRKARAAVAATPPATVPARAVETTSRTAANSPRLHPASTATADDVAMEPGRRPRA